MAFARVVAYLFLLLVPHVAGAEPLFTYATRHLDGQLILDKGAYEPPGTVRGQYMWGGVLTTPTGEFVIWAADVGEGFWPLFTSGPFLGDTEETVGYYDTLSRFAAGGTLRIPLVTGDVPDPVRVIPFDADLGPWDVRYGEYEGEVTVPFFNGRFDPADAAFLGVPSQGISGQWHFWLEHDHSEDPADGAFLFTSELHGIEVASVPEPGIALLLFAAFLARKWRAA